MWELRVKMAKLGPDPVVFPGDPEHWLWAPPGPCPLSAFYLCPTPKVPEFLLDSVGRWWCKVLHS